MESRDTCLVSRLLETWFLNVSVLAQSRHLYVLSWFCLLFPCLIIYRVSRLPWLYLSDIAKCLFCAETLAFLAECRPQGQSTLAVYLLTVKRLFLWLLLFYDYGTEGGLGPLHFVLDGDPAPPPKKRA